jgi:MPBQ/MSBQ methyltransferase
VTSPLTHPPPIAASRRDQLIAYYEEAGPDFGEWSANFNMHFGYYRSGLSLWRRDPMLEEMNSQVLTRLALPTTRDDDLIVDMGCGVGATVRHAARLFPRTRVCGITVVPWQVDTGNKWNERVGLYPRARLELADYTATGLAPASIDGAYAIESACHAEGSDKAGFIREAARILKPGARLVVADGFLKNPDRPLGRLFSALHRELCEGFVVPEMAQIEHFTRTLRRCGFDEVTVDDASWRVAPSAVQAPLAVLWFVLKKALRREHLGARSVGNLKGSVLSAILGANRSKFGYYLITATRR